MRDLEQTELLQVTGAGCSPEPPSCDCDYEAPSKRRKNNHGYGNGPESGPPPGRSGEHNPQLIEDNRGPRGPR